LVFSRLSLIIITTNSCFMDLKVGTLNCFIISFLTNKLFYYYETVKVGIGGFSMGAAIALYSATCYAMGRYSNGIPYPVSLRAIVGLSGWLPGSRYPIL
jgi:hypothetical protein